jgi:hypothetical protein
MWISKVSLKTAKPETIQKALEWCSYCVQRDRTFTYQLKGDFLMINSPTRNQAYKRGNALHKRYGLFYNVEKQNQKT